MGRNGVTVLGLFLILALFIYMFFQLFTEDEALRDTAEYGVEAIEQLRTLDEQREDFR